MSPMKTNPLNHFLSSNAGEIYQDLDDRKREEKSILNEFPSHFTSSSSSRESDTPSSPSSSTAIPSLSSANHKTGVISNEALRPVGGLSSAGAGDAGNPAGGKTGDSCAVDGEDGEIGDDGEVGDDGEETWGIAIDSRLNPGCRSINSIPNPGPPISSSSLGSSGRLAGAAGAAGAAAPRPAPWIEVFACTGDGNVIGDVGETGDDCIDHALGGL